VDFDRLQPALADLSAEFEEDLVGYLRAITRFALNEVPQCVGISITIIDDQGIPFTVTATDPYVRTLDGTQYLDDGPCLDSIRHGDPIAVDDVLDERRWHAYAESAAARGIRSSLSLPLLFDGSTIGALNLYGSSPAAFDDRAHLLAELISGHAALAIRNADLSLQMADRAAVTSAAPSAEPDSRVEQAVTVLAQHKQLSPDEARHRLHSAAARAGSRPAQLAEAIFALNGTR
jgi:GAF domain-containing protein